MLRLKKRCENIEGINHIQDFIYDGSKVLAVLYDFQSGNILTKQIDQVTFQEKVTISNDLISTSKVLSKHFIYPLDYKSDNAVYDGTHSTVIALDDIHTKMKYMFHPFLRQHSIFSLKNLIIDIFSGDQYRFDRETLKQLGSFLEHKKVIESYLCFYSTLEDFLKKRVLPKDLLFINPFTIDDMGVMKIKQLVELLDFKVILFLEGKEQIKDLQYVKKVLDIFEKTRIPVYDIYLRNEEQNLADKMRQCAFNYQVENIFVDGFFNLTLDKEIEYYANACKQKIR